jgi:predicted nuclease of predicted toxin-antitoxin system
MRVLLDECLPRRLKFDLPGHDVYTVPEMQWDGLKNGVLLQRAEVSFDVFVTADQNLRYQQNLISREIAVVILLAPDNRLETLRPIMPALLTALGTLSAGDVIRLSL